MATINRNWLSYAIVKVIRNWVEYDLWVVTQAEYEALLAELWTTQEELEQALEDLAAAQAALTNAQSQISSLQVQLAEANARANINVHYWSWQNYNWDLNMDWWYWSDSFEFVYMWWPYRPNAVLPLSNILRFDNGTKYVFGAFTPINWSSKTSYARTFISPFEYYVINKADGTITRNRWWVNSIQTSSWTYTSWWRNTENAIPNQWWIEYQTEYRAYYWYDNYNSTYPDRQNNIAWYFYIKKDLSACWYVKADDNISRDQYWIWPDGTSLNWYSISDRVSDYNVNKIGPVSNVNIRYNNKLYTPTWYVINQNSGNDWFWYMVMYYVTN